MDPTTTAKLMALMSAVLTTTAVVVLSSACGGRTPSEAGGRTNAVKQASADPYVELPTEARESVRRVVARLVMLEKSGQWDAIFDILDNEGGESRDHFLAGSGKSARLKEFTVSRVFALPQSGDYVVVGCAAFAGPDGTTDALESSVHVRLVDGAWKTGPVAIILDKDAPGGTRRCAALSR